MASLFEGVNEVKARRNERINDSTKDTLTRSGSIDNLLGNKVMRATKRGAMLGEGIQEVAKRVNPALFGESEFVKVKKINDIRQQMAQEFQGQPRDDKYFNKLAERLESEGYVNEGDQARVYGQQFRKTESEIRTSTGNIPAQVLAKNQQLLSNYAEDGVDVSNVSADTFSKTSQLVTHLEGLKDEQKDVSEET